MLVVCFFFFKQKTAYEMRISDWSSDVCSSDLLLPQRRPRDLDAGERAALVRELLAIPRHSYATRGIEPARGMRDDYLTDTPEGFRFRVFGREGRPCPSCGGPIERREIGSPRLDLWPRCQRWATPSGGAPPADPKRGGVGKRVAGR